MSAVPVADSAEGFDALLDEFLRADLLDAERLAELEQALLPLRDRVAELRERMAERRERLASLLDAHGVCGDQRPFGRVSLVRNPPAVEVVDAGDLSPAFLRVKAELNKEAIRKALLAGDVVPGARLSNGSVSVRISR